MKERPPGGEPGGQDDGTERGPVSICPHDTPHEYLSSSPRHADALAALDNEVSLLHAVINVFMAESADSRSPWLQDVIDAAVSAWSDLSRVREAIQAEDAEGVPT